MNFRITECLVALLVLASYCANCAAIVESGKMKSMREKAKHRARGIIYNNDGNELYLTRLNSVQDFLNQRTEPSLGTQVNSTFYCTGVTTLYAHDTDIAERADTLVDSSDFSKRGIYPFACNWRDNMKMLRAAGTDELHAVVTRLHEKGQELFWSHRINDVHDSVLAWPHLLSKWKINHPQYLMGVPEDSKKYPMSSPRFWWSTLDFEKPEVRNYLYRITEEVCKRFDVDGIEIDYFRSPMFFRPNLDMKPATRAQLDIMTEFQRRIHEMAIREGNRRGRPILVAVRLPMTVISCNHVGIDIKRWLEEGLLDVLTMEGGYAPFTMPTRELVKLGHKHNVPVYPTISNSGMPGRHNAVEYWRGVAANAWNDGADGIYLFNHFPAQPNDALFTQLGSPKTLKWLDKVFAIDNQFEDEGDLAQAIQQSDIIPVKLTGDGNTQKVYLPVGDDIRGAARAGKLSELKLMIQCEPASGGVDLTVTLNGHNLASSAPSDADGWLTYNPAPSFFIRGRNTIIFSSKQSVTIRCVEAHVNYKQN